MARSFLPYLAVLTRRDVKSTISAFRQTQMAIPMDELQFWFHHVGISVPDLEASIAWYERVLGLKLESRFTVASIPAEIAVLKLGALHVELFHPRDARPLPPDRRHPDTDALTHGTKHVAFGINDVEAFAAALNRRQVDVVWVRRYPDGRGTIFIRDNSGNLLEFITRAKDPQYVVELKN